MYGVSGTYYKNVFDRYRLALDQDCSFQRKDPLGSSFYKVTIISKVTDLRKSLYTDDSLDKLCHFLLWLSSASI